MSNIFASLKRRQKTTSSAGWLPLIGLPVTLLLLTIGMAYAGHCPPGGTKDCEDATTTAKNPLVPLAGGLGGAVAGAALRGRRRPEELQDEIKIEPELRIQNPWTGKPLTIWEPGHFGPGEDGNPGGPGMVKWGGNWMTPEDAREAIAKSLAADQQRAAASEEFAKQSEERSAEWMRDRVKQLQQEAERERQEAERERQQKQAREDAWKALSNIEDIANRHGYDNIWQRAQENAFRPDGSIDVDYVNRLRDTLRNRLGRDQAFPNESQQSWIVEGLSNTWNDARHNPIIRIGSGVLTGGASEVFFQSQGAWEAMQKSFNQAADRGRAWDLTDSVRSGYGQFLRGNLPLNTIEALRNPNATWGQVAMGAGMDAFTGLGLRNTINNVRGSLNAFQAGESWRNVLTQGGSGRNPFQPTKPEGASAIPAVPPQKPGTFIGRGSGGADDSIRMGPDLFHQYPPGTRLNPNATPPGQTQSLPYPTIKPTSGPLPPPSEPIRESIVTRLFGSRDLPVGRSSTPLQQTKEDCGLAVVQGMMRDSGRAVSNEQLRQAAMATGNSLRGGTSGMSLANLLRLNGAAAGGGPIPGETPKQVLQNMRRLIGEGKKVAAGVGTGETAHWVRVEWVSPGGLLVKFGDPATGLSTLTTRSNFSRMMQEAGNDVVVGRWKK